MAAFVPLDPPRLFIDFGFDDRPVESNDKTPITSASVCKAFGQHFIKNQGQFGAGPFVSFKCTNKIKPASEVKGKEKVKYSDWVLKVVSDAESVSFDIYFKDAKDHKVASLSIASQINYLLLLNDPVLARNVAAHLTTQLPMRSLQTKKALTVKNVFEVKIDPSELMPPPKNILRFSLTHQDGVWRPVILSSLKGPVAAKGVNIWSPPEGDKSEPINEKFYFLQFAGDRRPFLAALKVKIDENVLRVDEKYEGLSNSFLLGMRYGVSVGAKDSLLSKVAMVGVLVEIRSGPLIGVRFNYDAIPLKKASDSTGDQEFYWSRYQIGYAFGEKLDNDFINWYDVTPRIGFTNLHYKLGITQDTGYEEYKFTQNRAPTVGLEFGVESRSSLLLLRSWIYGTYSVGVLPIDRQYKTRAIRAGLDAYKALGSTQGLSVALLAFGAIDSTTITKELTDDEIASGDGAVTSFGLQSFFVGGGLSLVW